MLQHFITEHHLIVWPVLYMHAGRVLDGKLFSLLVARQLRWKFAPSNSGFVNCSGLLCELVVVPVYNFGGFHFRAHLVLCIAWHPHAEVVGLVGEVQAVEPIP